MDTTKIFDNGRSQAVRLPKAYRFEGDEVSIKRIGDLVVLFPRGKAWSMMAQGISRFSEDFMADREQPEQPDRRAG